MRYDTQALKKEKEKEEEESEIDKKKWAFAMNQSIAWESQQISVPLNAFSHAKY